MILKFKDKEFILQSIINNYLPNSFVVRNVLTDIDNSYSASVYTQQRSEATCKYLGSMNDLNHLGYLIDDATFEDEEHNILWTLHHAIITRMSCWAGDVVTVTFNFERATMENLRPRLQAGWFN